MLYAHNLSEDQFATKWVAKECLHHRRYECLPPTQVFDSQVIERVGNLKTREKRKDGSRWEQSRVIPSSLSSGLVTGRAKR